MNKPSYVATPDGEALRNDPPNCVWKSIARYTIGGRQSDKVMAIRELRSARGLGLKEAKDTVETYYEMAVICGNEPYAAPIGIAQRFVALPGDGGTLVLTTQKDGTVKVGYTFDFGTVAAENETEAAIQLAHRLRSLSRQMVKYRNKIV